MHKLNTHSQAGIALLFFLVILMGIGGVVLAGYTQGILKKVEASKFEHNQRVLKEAKQALLQFAYNYPVTNGNGPGRLPCADIDNDGDANTTFGDCITLGRLSWNEPNLNLYDIRDADGQRLWYAVSDDFATNVAGGNTINSDATGTITVRDQAGNVIYDGSSNGVAAVIIAPGKITARNGATQDRSVANADDPFDTNPDTDPGIINAANYLDRLVGTEDNANFAQGSATNGFILGPVDIQSTNAINDQIIVITAAEVIEVAEKAVLQAYRTAIDDYLAVTGNVYPWLFKYLPPCFGELPPASGTTEALCTSNGGVWRPPFGIGDLTSLYPANANFNDEKIYDLDNFGRIPSIFANYFTETNSQPIETKLNGSISWGGPATVNGFVFLDGPPAQVLPPNKIANVSFVDDPPFPGNGEKLIATFLNPESLDYEIYFWEYDHNTPVPYMGGWSLCAAPANQLSDCNRDSSGNPTPGVANDIDLDIIHLTVTLDFNGVVDFNINYANTPVIGPPVPASGTAHASITATFAGTDVISLPFLSATYERDEHYHEGDTALGEGNPVTTGTLNMNDFGKGPMSLTMRYYPQLPDWAFTNGWHNSIMMSYALDYRPDNMTDPCAEGTDCIQVNHLVGTNSNDNKISILTIAGQHDWDDEGADGFSNDLSDVFEGENAITANNIFDASPRPGNDNILVIEECAVGACP